MISIKIFWDDLTDEKKKEIEELGFGKNNWDFFPMAQIDIEDGDDEDEDIEKEDNHD